jgi:hypothetical protein
VSDALRLARTLGLTDVLVNITEMVGFESPGPAYRPWVATRWAATAGGVLRVAVVARHEHICPRKTGLLAAADQGLRAHICEAEPEAMAWLDAAASSPACSSRQ